MLLSRNLASVVKLNFNAREFVFDHCCKPFLRADQSMGSIHIETLLIANVIDIGYDRFVSKMRFDYKAMWNESEFQRLTRSQI